jgi:hypothetical protein
MSNTSKLYASQTNTARTANGMPTHYTTLSRNVDLFFIVGASRGKDISHQFQLAYDENKEYATRILQWARDVRGGSGERQTFRVLFRNLINYDQALAQEILLKIPELGRWDDVFAAIGTPLERKALSMTAKALHAEDGLCAKWVPRSGPVFAKLHYYMKLTPKELRKILVNLTSVVETAMCQKEWGMIDYSKLPSVASARYQRAFGRNDPTGYTQFIESLEKGETKINASAVFPHDIVNSVMRGNSRVADQQWQALPDYLQGNNTSILPLVDTSGSMSSYRLHNSQISCMEAAIALGIYISERSEGPFKNEFITFSAEPSFIHFPENAPLSRKIDTARRAPWGYNTDLLAVYKLILSAATSKNLAPSDLPSKILILSDMEFDEANTPRQRSWSSAELAGRKWDKTAHDEAVSLFSRAGYELPDIVYWNLNARPGNNPVQSHELGAALVSGFSPSIMKSILSDDVKSFTPMNVMLEAIMDSRYDLEQYGQK